ncbi:MAG: hypothetical protein HRU15_11200 [Planctomycetes bacterium]|nr:hypothetical protein [Planctomycetota bacterium]
MILYKETALFHGPITISSYLAGMLLVLCLQTASSSEDPDKNWALKETPVEDPIGLGERLALIDYFQEKGVKLDSGVTIGELRVEYWAEYSLEEKRLALYRELKEKYTLPHLSVKMSYKALLAQQKEALLRLKMAE